MSGMRIGSVEQTDSHDTSASHALGDELAHAKSNSHDDDADDNAQGPIYIHDHDADNERMAYNEYDDDDA